MSSNNCSTQVAAAVAEYQASISGVANPIQAYSISSLVCCGYLVSLAVSTASLYGIHPVKQFTVFLYWLSLVFYAIGMIWAGIATNTNAPPLFGIQYATLSMIWIANAYPIVSFFIFQRTKIFVPHIKKTILYKILMISIPLEIILDWTTIVLFAEWGYAGESSVYVSSNKVNGVNQLLNSINCTAMSLVMLYESTRASGGISNRLRAMIKQNSELLAFIFSEWLFVFGGACFMWSMQDSWPTFIIKNNAFCVRSSLLFIFNQKMVKQFIDKSKKLQRGVSETGGSIVGSSNATTGQGTSKTSSHL